MPLMPGAKLCEYEIVAPLGAGGMGQVWRARDSRLGREVAIKVLPDEVAGDAQRITRFGREARNLAALNHPHIAQIYGFAEADGVVFLVLELVEGEDLSQRIAKGPLPVAEAMEFARQIAEALEAAHERGIVHRDLKPANIRITRDETVKVLDFGLAKALDTTDSGPQVGEGAAFFSDFSTSAPRSARTPAPPTGDSLSDFRTTEGVVLGTPTYMAPEQARGKRVDKRVDVWAFGCVLYECLTGKRAFAGESVSDVLAAVIEREPDMTRLPAATPPRVRELLARCFAKDPRARLRDVGEARFALERTGVEPGGVASGVAAASPRRWSRTALMTIVGVAAAAFAASYMLFAPRDGARDVRAAVRAELFLPKGMTLVEDVRGVAVSPDGTQVVASLLPKSGASPSSLFLRDLARLDFRPLAGTEEGVFPFWSPDGKSIGFFASRKLKRVDLADGIVRVLCDAPAGRGGTWGTKGTIVFAPGAGGGLLIVSDGGGAPSPITKAATLGESHRVPQMLPDGTRFLYFAQNTKADGVYVRDPASDRTQLVLSGLAEALYIEPGFLVFARDENLMMQPFDLERLELAGSAKPIAAGIQYSKGRAFINASVSPRGALVYEMVNPPARYRIAWMDRKGVRTATPAEPVALAVWQGSLSKDGRRLVVAVAGSRAESGIAVIDLERGVKTTLGAPNSNFIYSPAWAPGEQGVIASEAAGVGQSVNVYPVGGGPGSPVFEGELGFEYQAASVTPDGKTLFFTQTPQRDKTGEIMTFSLGEKQPAKTFMRTPDAEWNPFISPSGEVVAYITGSEDELHATLRVVTYPTPAAPVQVSASKVSLASVWWLGANELGWMDTSRRTWKATISAKEGRLEVGVPQPLMGDTPLDKQVEILAYDIPRDRFVIAIAEEPRDDPRLVVVTDWRPDFIGAQQAR